MAVKRRKQGTRSAKTAPRRAGKVIYLYGVSSLGRATIKLLGIDGSAAVEPLRIGGFTAWVSHVDANEFGTELPQHMENLDWLANASVRHQRVVGALAAKIT